MLYLFYFLGIATSLMLCKVLYNILPMFGLCVTGLMIILFLWLALFKRRNDRYIGMDPNRSIKEQEEERMRKRLEEANKDPNSEKEGE